MANIVSLNISEKKGIPKTQVKSLNFEIDLGICGDAHAGNWHRQVSLLSKESIDTLKAKGLTYLIYGQFAENITTEGIVLYELPIGTKLKIGEQVLLEVTQIGKECHTRCAIFHQAGDCVMPREGIFAKVLKGGQVNVGDKIEVSENCA